MLASQTEQEHTVLTFLKMMLTWEESATAVGQEDKIHPTSKTPCSAKLSWHTEMLAHQYTQRINCITLETVNAILFQAMFGGSRIN